MVEDALSGLSMESVSHVEKSKRNLVKYVDRLTRLEVAVKDSPNGGMVVHHNYESSLVVKVKSKQNLDLLFMELKELTLGKMN